MRALNTINLSGLRAVEAIGRTGSLATAAAELGVTPGALSQRLAKIEAALGRTLFARRPGGLVPTAPCAAALPRLTRALQDMAATVEDLRATGSRTLTVSVAPIFASRWLIWRIHRFAAAHPDISVRLEPTVALVDPDASGVDACIRVGRTPGRGVEATRLLQQRVFPVCAPALGATIATPADLFRHPVIRETEQLFGWDVWLDGHGLAVADIPAGPSYGDASLCLDAAMAGQGVFMAWETLAADQVDGQRLVAPFPDRVATGASYWFLTGPHSGRRPALRSFRTWLQAEMDRSVADWRRAATLR
ncbi:LysR substrate-binding domain-containing protein [Psychromarinibacter sp. C21-152]|uniref:LysR substrate-binding domain-containing protein n=1 Tax=Psychromarinibacter sediminicola TaxID=3033385 RepID=A0AAE3NSX9_9RHOB|nr:LysR substrate-binding domain-containing protein [Psychromarinibacter sediminicola]MDF0599972.1 LysR substrate-binding domain-containing protein [Psychromarinibacter sediminicola]